MNMKLKLLILVAIMSVAFATHAHQPHFLVKSLPVKAQVPKDASGKVIIPVSDAIINTQPAGIVYTNVNRSGCGFFYSYFTGNDFGYYTCTLGEYVQGDDGNVYIKNPYSQKKTGSYIKLEPLAGDTLVAHMPQAITELDDEKTYAMRLRLHVADEGFTYYPDTLADGTIDADVKFVMRNDSIIQLGEGIDQGADIPKTILGEVNADGIWTGFGDDNVVYSIIHEQPAVLPQGAVLLDYRLHYAVNDTTSGDKMLKLAIVDEKDIYVENPIDPQQWMRGEISGDKAVFKTQYLGRNEDENCHQYLVPATCVAGKHGNDYTMTESLTFDYNVAEKTFTALPGYALLVNAGTDNVTHDNRLATFDDPVLMPYVEVSATPAAPVINKATSDDTGWGGSLEFKIKTEDVDGNYIDGSKLYYRIFFDNAETPYSFTDKSGNAMIDVPCDYTDDSKFFYFSGVHYIISIPLQFKKVGIQSVNMSGGEEKVSTTTWYVIEGSGINGIVAEKQVTGVACYDLSGRRMSGADVQGICVKVTTFSDGSREALKVVR